jgi:hypothetical protein
MADPKDTSCLSSSQFTTPDARKLSYEELTKLADHLFSKGVSAVAPFADMPVHQSELRLASACLRLLAFARIHTDYVPHSHGGPRRPFLITFSREGREDEVRLAWNGEEALRVGKSTLSQRAELLPGDALRVQWNGSADRIGG